MKYKCLEAIVKFNKQGHQGLRIGRGEVTSAHCLAVSFSQFDVVIEYLDKDNDVRKVLVFNRADVLEVSMEGMHREPRAVQS